MRLKFSELGGRMRLKLNRRSNIISWDSIPNLNSELHRMYCIEKMTLNEMACQISISPTRIKDKLQELGIKIRTREESLSLKMKRMYNKAD